MPRLARVDVPFQPYHVINRAIGRLRIFRTDADYKLFVDLLEKTLKKVPVELLAFTLMPNHFHMVLYPHATGDMKRFMHLLLNAHTRLVHTKTKTIGHGPLYQGRYKSFMIGNDTHLLTVIKYVERNPVRAKESENVQDWKWGSAWIRAHGSSEQKQLLSEGPTPLPKNYQTWVNTEDKDEILKRLRTSVNKGAPFGSDDWVNVMVDTHKLGSTLREGGRPRGSKNR